jgi:hypothetical protein
MDHIEAEVVRQAQTVAEVAKALGIQEAAIRSAGREASPELADRAQVIAAQLERLEHEMLSLASSWHLQSD